MTTPSGTAVVTGAARGIGKAIVRRLRTDGYQIIAVDMDAAELQSAWGDMRDVTAITMDIRDTDQAKRLAGTIQRQNTSIDILVNNAGVDLRQPFFELTDDDWHRLIGTNLTGTFNMSRALWPVLKKPGAAIVNISSIHGQRPLSGMAGYAASKGGINALTAAMALDAAPHGVRVVAIAPGFVDAALPQRRKRRRAVAAERWLAATLPLGRKASTDEVADAVAWSASGAAAYLTGTTVVLDGGVTARAYREFDR